MLVLTFPTSSEKMSIMLISDIEKINIKLDNILLSRIKELNHIDNKEGIEELKENIKCLKYSTSKLQSKIKRSNSLDIINNNSKKIKK